MKHWDEIVQQYFELIVIIALMFVFRPRIWPEYFSIGLYNGEDLAEQIEETNNAIVQEYRVVPYFKTEINRSFMDSSNSSFSSQSQVVILDPIDSESG